MKQLPLSALHKGQWGRVERLPEDAAMAGRLRDLGLIEGTRVSCAFHAPGGDPGAYLFRGTLIAIRAKDAAGVLLEAEAI